MSRALFALAFVACAYGVEEAPVSKDAGYSYDVAPDVAAEIAGTSREADTDPFTGGSNGNGLQGNGHGSQAR